MLTRKSISVTNLEISWKVKKLNKLNSNA